MTSVPKLVLCLFACFGGSLVHGGITNGPMNHALVAGNVTVLECSADNVNARVIWYEYTTTDLGAAISDNRNMFDSHPNRARYSILGTGLVFNLEIRDIIVQDGGRYRCSDISSAPGPGQQADAELVVMESDPVCPGISTVSGAVIEGLQYSQECEVRYRGNFVPNMTWTGPGVFETEQSVTSTSVWTQVKFVADRSIMNGVFVCATKYEVPDGWPPGGATNNPDYSHESPRIPILVHWGPANMNAQPIKDFYVAGDNITCFADSNPTSRYQWYNMRLLLPEAPGAVFTVTSALEGTEQVMRCNAQVLIEGGLWTLDLFINVTVPAITTPTIPPTTPPSTAPPVDSPCTDLTGLWSSTNPNANLCIEMDARGNILTLIRNGTDPYFVPGNGKVVYGDFKHVGFTGLWPVEDGGAAAFVGECHRCYGDEVILLSGMARTKNNSPDCGVSGGTQLTRLYIMTRYGPPCRNMDIDVYRPSPDHIKYMQIPEKHIKL
jgi:hypothetical protein